MENVKEMDDFGKLSAGQPDLTHLTHTDNADYVETINAHADPLVFVREQVTLLPVTLGGVKLWRENNGLYLPDTIRKSSQPWDWDSYAHIHEGKVYRNSTVIGSESEIENVLKGVNNA